MNNRTIKMRAAGIAACVGIISTTVFCSNIARADDFNLPTKPVDLTLKGSPIQTALKLLFSGTGVSYSLDNSITGTVTLDLHQVPFSAALNTILNSTSPPLTMSTDDGIVNIKPASATPPPTTAPTPDQSQPAAPIQQPQPIYQPAPTDTTPTVDRGQADAGVNGFSMQQFEVIQLKYANARLLLSVFGQPSLVVPPTTLDSSTGGGGGGGTGGTGNQRNTNQNQNNSFNGAQNTQTTQPSNTGGQSFGF